MYVYTWYNSAYLGSLNEQAREMLLNDVTI